MKALTLMLRPLMGVFGVAGLLAAGAAHAQLPDGNWTATGQLMVETSSSIGATCDANAEGTADASTGTGSVTDLEFSAQFGDPDTDYFICNNVVDVKDLPYGVEAINNDTQLEFTGVNVDTSIGNCSGDIVGDWNPASSSNGEIAYNNASLGSCTVNGSLDVNW